jgi:hypothetical protein
MNLLLKKSISKILHKNDINNIVFITTVVHFLWTVNITQGFDEDDITLWILINSPLQPGILIITVKSLQWRSIFNFGNFKIEEDEMISRLIFYIM